MARNDRTTRWTVPTLAALAFLAVPALASAGPGYVNFLLGQKIFDSDHWDPIDKQSTIGAEGVFGKATWPVSLDAYLARASKEKSKAVDDGFGGTVDVTLDATTYEFGLGVNKTWQRKKFYPYLNAGAVLAKIDVTARQAGTSVSDDDKGLGFWGGGGVFYRVGTTFNLGGAVRYSSANVEFNAFDTGNVSFDGADVPAGGLTFGILLGWGWPKTP
jgi:outer membrane protein with beta-barrel domain